MSSASEAGQPSGHNASMVGGSARSTREAGQRPQRKAAEQNSLWSDPLLRQDAGLGAIPANNRHAAPLTADFDQKLPLCASIWLETQAANDCAGLEWRTFSASAPTRSRRSRFGHWTLANHDCSSNRHTPWAAHCAGVV